VVVQLVDDEDDADRDGPRVPTERDAAELMPAPESAIVTEPAAGAA
jgi:hypothetical protein